MGRPANMVPLQYDWPYIWCPNIYSRPFELYPLYKCRAGHQVFSKVTLSQGAARLNRHYMASAEHIIGRIRLSAKLSAEHTVGRTQLSAEYTVGRTHYQQNTTIGRTQWLAEQTVRIHCWQNTTAAQHVIVIGNLPMA